MARAFHDKIIVTTRGDQPMALNKRLPPRYAAAPRVHLGTWSEIDVASFEEEEPSGLASPGDAGNGSVTTALAVPARTSATARRIEAIAIGALV